MSFRSSLDLKRDEECQIRIERILTPTGAPADFSQPGVPVQHRVYGNPAPLGLTALGFAHFLLALVTLQSSRVPSPILAPALLFAGTAQALCAAWEMMIGNSYMATVLGSLSAWCLSYGTVFLPSFNLNPSDPTLGLFHLSWMAVMALMLAGSFRSSLALLSVLLFTTATLLASSVQQLADSDGARIAAAVLGLLAAASSWWAGMAGFWLPDSTWGCIRVSPVELHAV